MDIIALKLAGLVALLLPLLAAFWALWRRRWRHAPPSECLLAALLCIPVALLLLIAGLGSLPFGKPLHFLLWAQVALSAGGLWLAWRQRTHLAAAVRQLFTGFKATWREARWLHLVVFVLGLLTHCFSTVYGVWNTPWSCDEFSYHIPQAVQPYQDGRLGPVQANVIWADAYPRGAALLFYWTLQLTRTDAGFHAVNAAFGFVFILAAYVAAMRLRLGRGWSVFAAGIVPTAPLFWYLSGIGYIDLSVGGVMATMLAFVLSERGRTWSWGSCAAALLAAVLALWMKFPAIALVGFALGARGLAQTGAQLAYWFRRKDAAMEKELLSKSEAAAWNPHEEPLIQSEPRPSGSGLRGQSPVFRPSPLPDGRGSDQATPIAILSQIPTALLPTVEEKRAAISPPASRIVRKPTPNPFAYAVAVICALLIAAVPYIRTWRTHGSPAYPVRVRVGSHVIFDGPMDTKLFKRMNDRPILERYTAFWSNWHNPIHTDSEGAFGPLFTLAMPVATLACLVAALRRREPDWLFMAAAFWLALGLPEHHVPRYAIYLLLPGAVCIARLGRAFENTELASGWTAAAALLVFWNLYVIRINFENTMYWQSNAGVPLFTEARNRPIVDRTSHGDEAIGPTPETRRALYEQMKDGETLVTAVGGYFGLFYDYRYHYRVEHRPAKTWPYGFTPNQPQHRDYGQENIPEWRAGLLRDRIAAVIVYTGGAEDRALAAPDSGYAAVYEQPAPPAGSPMRVYHRKTEP